ncbi:alpha/beta hydrolase [Kibdelosporangium lantanae]
MILSTVAALAAALAIPVTAPGVTWGDCDPAHAAYRCATLDVPLTYQDPDGPKIQLALGKLPATDQARKLGTVFYNPGGPGASGRYAPPLTPAIHQYYDIVGFDPRGVGASTALQCFTDPSELAILQKAYGTFPITAADAPDYLAAARAVTDLCARNAGPLIGHLSTANVARDLDRVRAALGESKLRYYGKSYGSVVAENYVNLFPDKVDRVVLDAVDDPARWAGVDDPDVPVSVRLGGHLGSQQALESYRATCGCTFSFEQILQRLNTGPVTVTDPDTGAPAAFTYQSFVNRVHAYLTDAKNAPKLTTLLTSLSQARTGAVGTAAQATIPTPADSALGGAGTLCADTANPTDQAAWPKYAAEANQAAPGFGAHDTYISIPCATWPASDPDRYRGPWNRPTRPILLLANKQGDPETPYDGARRAERALGNARLLSLDTWGHGSLGHSPCVDSAVDRYFFAGQLPPRDAVCPSQ